MGQQKTWLAEEVEITREDEEKGYSWIPKEERVRIDILHVPLQEKPTIIDVWHKANYQKQAYHEQLEKLAQVTAIETFSKVAVERGCDVLLLPPLGAPHHPPELTTDMLQKALRETNLNVIICVKEPKFRK